jgi:hypothetical protein
VAQDVFVTRLHVRYDAESFPEDLRFKTTGDKSNFQGRYILRHAYEGEMECEMADEYRQQVAKRQEAEVKTLANLTGWDVSEIREKVRASGVELGDPEPSGPWWKRLWDD